VIFMTPSLDPMHFVAAIIQETRIVWHQARSSSLFLLKPYGLTSVLGSHCSILNIINKVSAFSDRAQLGGWNDLDMLEVGNGGMTDDEV
jgi:hypothetical protein